MQNYDPENIEFFPTNRDEVMKLPKAWAYDISSYKHNMMELRKRYGNEVEDFTIRQLPFRKNKHDPCRLLVIQICGSLFAKRHNNSQYLTLDL